jgi:hypothetical protein
MNRVAVASSNIASIGYEPELFILEVEFLNGTVYQYYDVPPEVYEAFLAAGSKGSFHHRNIRNVYRYARVM